MESAYRATRRAVVSALITMANPGVAHSLRSKPAEAERGCQDPAVQLLGAWQEARAEQRRLCARRDKIEASLIKAIGYPRVLVTKEDDEAGAERYAVDGATIDHLLGRTIETQDLRQSLKADLRRQKIRWAASAKASGLRDALALERAADRTLDKLTDAMVTVEGRTIQGVMSKLLVALEMSEAGPCEQDVMPWSHLRSALADLARLSLPLRTERLPENERF